ncbi:hypothetical protein KHA94_21520 [Bacillus sp. FJAT-49705]|uniref:Uncharacterized protein n=2 Tax=Cytobacillus citreus TaxID=2833586 RepID=A0ABS5NY21_9BACI|nr:hypothetical protein [Cytobacillus citreus]MBS4192725.1 hypothetical protein [Cytobacillus citreus]
MLFSWNLIGLGLVYRIFKKKNLSFDDRFSMTMCMAITMISPLIIALHIELLLPGSLKALFLIPILLGLLIGWKFGSLIKAPALLTSIYNGTMGGIMGTMLGAVLQNPALCNIPIESEAMMTANMYSLAIFTTFLHTLVFILSQINGQ